jgi:tetratricopeptide (TPR) repeat protein
VSNPDGDLDLIDTLGSLVDKSLVRQEGEDEPRFSMLETIGEYAGEKLRERGEGDRIRDAHAGYFLSRSEEAQPFLERRQGREWLARLSADRDNLRAAFRRLLDGGRSEEAARMATALWGFWRSLPGYWIEGRQQLEAALLQSDLSDGTRAQALIRLCNAVRHEGDLDRTEEAAREVVSIGRRLDDPATEFYGAVSLWAVASERGNRDQTAAMYASCLALAAQTTDREIGAQVLRMQGFDALQNGDLDGARESFAAEVALRRDPEVGGDIHGALLNLGEVLFRGGDLDGAEAAYVESGAAPAREGIAHVALARGQLDRALEQLATLLPRLRADNARPGIAASLEGIAQVALQRGDTQVGAVLFGAAEALYDSLGYAHDLFPGEQERIDGVRAAMGEEAWSAARRRGGAMSMDDVVTLALEYSARVSPVAEIPSAADRPR